MQGLYFNKCFTYVYKISKNRSILRIYISENIFIFKYIIDSVKIIYVIYYEIIDLFMYIEDIKIDHY